LTKQRPTVQTQFLIFTLFGDYILPRGGEVWTSSLLYLLNLLGVSERAARSTLSRMSRKGWVKAHRQGRRSRYSLTERGRALLKSGERRIFEPLYTDWDGRWFVVIYSLPESMRDARHQLRQNLIWLGFGALSPGTWISPHDRRADLERLLDDLQVREYVEMFVGRHLGNASDREMIRRCWDLDGLVEQYRRFIERYQPEYEQCAMPGNGEPDIPPEVCFVRRFWLTHEFQSFPLKDPNLPVALLSPDWVGFRARRLFEEYRALLSTKANAFVDAVMNGEHEAVPAVQTLEENRLEGSWRISPMGPDGSP